MSFTKQELNPLHIENSVNSMGKEDLKLPQAFKTYKNMLLDDAIGGGFTLTQNLFNKLSYHIPVPKKSKGKEKEMLVALNKSLNYLDGMNKVDFLNYIFSMAQYGHSMFEMVFKKEGNFQVFNTFVPIHPTTINRYEFKRNTLSKLVVDPVENDGLIIQESASQTELSGDKVLMFRLNGDLDNPLGRSILSRAYMPWKKKQIAAEYELIGIAKNLSGVLKIKAPTEYLQKFYSEPASVEAKYMEEMLSQAELLHAGKTSLVVCASDTQQNGVALFDITTISSSEQGNMDVGAVLQRYNNEILTTLFTDIMSMGEGKGGSFALSDAKTNILSLVIQSMCVNIQETFRKAVKQAYMLNGVPLPETVPSIEFEPVERLDFEAFSRGWQRLAQSNLVEPDGELEMWFRERLGAPEKDVNSVRAVKQDPLVNDQNDREEKEA